jgi:putative hydrolase of the HAD superfamily
MIKVVFFDVGHTLIYAYPSVGRIYSKITSSLGVKVPARILSREFTKAFYAYMGSSAPERFITSNELDRKLWRRITHVVYKNIPQLWKIDFLEWFERLYQEFGRPSTWRLYDDVMRTLRGLKEKCILTGIISNWDTRLREILKGLGLEEMMDFIVISAELGYRKPDRRIFLRGLELSGASPQEALHVGDVYQEDVLGAISAGIKPLLLDRRGMLKKVPQGVIIINGLEGIFNLIDSGGS